MNRKSAVRILQTLAFCLLLAFSLVSVSNVLERKESQNRFGPFFEQKEDYDVIFLGNSHMTDSVLPLELFENYGIVSYNMAGYGNSIPLSYWVLRNALDYTTPRVVVLEIHNVRKTYRLSGSSGDEHKALDVFPLSLNKARAIEDLMSDPEAFNDDGHAYPDLKWEFYFPIGKYHSRWNNLDREDFVPNPTREKGAGPTVRVGVPEEYYIIDENEVMEENGFGFEYLRKIIEECQARNIDVLLTHMPFPASEDEQMEGNTVWYIADEYGVDLLDFVNMDQVADYDTDLADSSHLNISGARKVTDFLGEYLTAYYDLEDRRQDLRYADWHEEVQAYRERDLSRIRYQENLENLLMLAHGSNLDVCVSVPEDAALYENEKLMRLMQNIGREHVYEEDMFAKWSNALFPLERLEEAAASGDQYIALICADSVEEWVGDEAKDALDTALGCMELGENGSLLSIGTDSGLKELFHAEETLEANAVQLVFFDRETGEPVHTVQANVR